MTTFYPLIAKLEIHITDGDGTNGAATYQCPFNRLPTEAEMPAILDKINDALPLGFRLMTRHESLMHYLREEQGYRGPDNMHMPRLDDGDEWHDPETANVYMASDEDDYPEED